MKSERQRPFGYGATKSLTIGTSRPGVLHTQNRPLTWRGESLASRSQCEGGNEKSEVADRILDKGIVIDAWVRVYLVGIELLAIEARVVIAGVETFLKYAEAVGLLPEEAA